MRRLLFYLCNIVLLILLVYIGINKIDQKSNPTFYFIIDIIVIISVINTLIEKATSNKIRFLYLNKKYSELELFLNSLIKKNPNSLSLRIQKILFLLRTLQLDKMKTEILGTQKTRNSFSIFNKLYHERIDKLFYICDKLISQTSNADNDFLISNYKDQKNTYSTIRRSNEIDLVYSLCMKSNTYNVLPEFVSLQYYCPLSIFFNYIIPYIVAKKNKNNNLAKAYKNVFKNEMNTILNKTDNFNYSFLEKFINENGIK
jgi:hypothetical protein